MKEILDKKMLTGEILIISRNSVIQKNLRKILEFEGHSCSVFLPQESKIILDPFLLQLASEVSENINQVDTSPRYDLGILDMEHPGRLSKKYLSWIKKRSQDFPIIFLVDEGKKTWPLPKSLILVELVKPFKSEQIMELVQNILPAATNSIMANGC